ncbi:hypothetical protein, partial [Streptomyces griseus]|uniref:hypothetical protein n=1 Tax=Streptomyces griseus TaxID=1911 RepID=UPI00386DCC3B
KDNKALRALTIPPELFMNSSGIQKAGGRLSWFLRSALGPVVTGGRVELLPAPPAGVARYAGG